MSYTNSSDQIAAALHDRAHTIAMRLCLETQFPADPAMIVLALQRISRSQYIYLNCHPTDLIENFMYCLLTSPEFPEDFGNEVMSWRNMNFWPAGRIIAEEAQR